MGIFFTDGEISRPDAPQPARLKVFFVLREGGWLNPLARVLSASSDNYAVSVVIVKSSDGII